MVCFFLLVGKKTEYSGKTKDQLQTTDKPDYSGKTTDLLYVAD